VEKLNNFDFVILIPVFNCQKTISELSIQINKYLNNKSFFICFVDDSTDERTSNEINKCFKDNFFILKRKKIENYSTRFSASLDGFKWINDNIKTKYVVEIDSDLAHHPKDINKGIDLLREGDCDLVIGSKYLSNSTVKDRPFERQIISRVLTIICKIIFTNHISDYTNTFRFYNIKLVKDFIYRRMIFKSPIGHLDNLLYIIKKKYKIKEISTEYIEYNDESTIKVISMLRYLIEFFKCVTLNKFF